MSPTIHPKGPEAIMNSDHHPTQQFDLLAELAKFGFEQSISLNNPQAIPKFATFVGESLGKRPLEPRLAPWAQGRSYVRGSARQPWAICPVKRRR